jgi:hypothetical protein
MALLLSPVGILLIAAARLLIIADYNTVTASAIVTSEGYVNALLGTIIPIVPIIMPYLALILLFFRRLIPGVLASLAAVLISPAAVSRRKALSIARRDFSLLVAWPARHIWIFPLAAAVAVLLVAVAGLGFSIFTRTLGTILSLALVIYVIRLYPLPVNNTYYTELLQQPWMPAEKITFTSHPPVIGYVLSTTDVAMEVLTNNDRSIVFFPNSIVAHQQICQIDAEAAIKPLITLIPAAASIPLCNPPASGSRPALTCPGGIYRLHPCQQTLPLPVDRAFVGLPAHTVPAMK